MEKSFRRLLVKLKGEITFIPIGLRFVNFIYQKVLRLNSDCPFPVHFTSQIRHGSHIECAGKTRKLFAKMSQCNIQALHGIKIGDNTIFASGLTLISANHNINDIWCGEPPVAPPINIGEMCWIGANVIILPGVSLGNNVIVGAGSVVTKSFPDGVTIVGNPAKIINFGEKSRNSCQSMANSIA